MAIVSPIAGTTRDRKIGVASLAGLEFNVTDTGGLDHFNSMAGLLIQSQIEQSLHSSDLILFMMDAKAGVTASDVEYANWLRKSLGKLEKNDSSSSSSIEPTLKRRREIVLVLNKTEGAHLSDAVVECMSEAAAMGLGEPLLISSGHGDG